MRIILQQLHIAKDILFAIYSRICCHKDTMKSLKRVADILTRIESSRHSFTLFGAVLFFLLFNMAPLLASYRAVTERQEVPNTIFYFLHYFVTVFPYYMMISLTQVFFLFSSRIIFILLGPLIFILSGMIAYFTYIYGVVFTDEIIQAVLATDEREVSGFVSNELWAWLGVVLMTFLLLLRIHHRNPHMHHFHKGYFVFSSLLIILLVVHIPTGVPFNAIAALIDYEITEHHHNDLRHQKDNISRYTTGYNKDLLKDLTIVLVIGESARADHFHINGYSRNTTPELEKIPNLVNFTDVTACGNNTNISVPCLLTRATRKDLRPIYTETSFLSVFKALKLPVIWATNNDEMGGQSVDIKAIANNFDEVTHFDIDARGKSTGHLIYSNIVGGKHKKKDSLTDDIVLLPPFDKALKHYNENLVMVLHTFGSHVPYHLAYPPKYAQFKPDCTLPATQCARNIVINTYDNTIFFTDHFIASVIERVKDRKALVIYVSDHGELLGEHGRWVHGINQETGPEQYHVPMIWFVSDSLMKSRPDLIPLLKKHQTMHLSHDFIFHSVLDCLGIENSVIDKKLSLCR